jgi:hypothetical protein
MLSTTEPPPPGAAVRSAVLYAAAATLIGLALQIRSGHYQPVALLLVAFALVATALGVRARPLPFLREGDPPVLERVAVLGVAASLVAHVIRPPGIHLDVSGFLARVPFSLGLLAVGLLVAAAVRYPAQTARIRLPALLSLFLLLGAWVIEHSPSPRIDVFTVQRDGIAGLLAGHNPYSLTFPDIYGATSPYYPPGFVVDGRLQFGFTYPPQSLLLGVPGAVLAGDFRYSQLVALTVAGGLMAATQRTLVGFLAAALLLFSPRTFFVIEQSWTDTYVVALLAVLVFCAVRAPRAVGVALGLFLVSKHYLFLALPMLWLLRHQLGRGRRLAITLLTAFVVGAAITLPLALRDFPAFWHNLVTVQTQMPFRLDSLSFTAALARLTGQPFSSTLGFLAWLVGAAVALRRCPATPAGFSAGLTLSYFAFFAFNRQAFCNYYFFILGALCVAVAATPAPQAGGRPASASPAPGAA